MSGTYERGFDSGGASEETSALLNELETVLARHGLGGMAIEAMELTPVGRGPEFDNFTNQPGIFGARRLPDFPYPRQSDAGAWVKAGPARRCPDGKPAVWQWFSTPDGKVNGRWVCP